MRYLTLETENAIEKAVLAVINGGDPLFTRRDAELASDITDAVVEVLAERGIGEIG